MPPAPDPSSPLPAQASIEPLEPIGGLAVARDLDRVFGEVDRSQGELRSAQLEIAELRARLRQAQREVAQIQSTLAFRLGMRIVSAKSLKSQLTLPLDLVRIYREFRRERAAKAGGQASATPSASRAHLLRSAERMQGVPEALKLVDTKGVDAAMSWLQGSTKLTPRQKARALVEVAMRLFDAEDPRAAEVSLAAARLDSEDPHVRSTAYRLFDLGRISDAVAVLDQLTPPSGEDGGAERRRIQQVRDWNRLHLEPPQLERVAITAPRIAKSSPVVLLVADRSLPHHTTATTLRLHDHATSLAANGFTPVVVTEPGYAMVAGQPVEAAGQSDVVDGVTYRRLPGQTLPQGGEFHEGPAEFGGAVARIAAEVEASIVHAQSDSLSAALAAHAAARRAGVPFVLDIPGLWINGDPAFPAYLATERYKSGFDTIGKLARAANHVVARCPNAARMLEREGLTRDDFTVLPDLIRLPAAGRPSADTRFARQFGLRDRFVFGQIGALFDHKGIETLLDVLAGVRASEPKSALFIAGPGRAGHHVRALAAERGLAEHVVVQSSASRHRMAAYQRLLNVAVFPRRATDVAQLASPFDLINAMAHDVPVVAAATQDHLDLVEDGVNGLVVPIGDTEAMTRSVLALRGDGERAAALAAAARERLEAARSAREILAGFERVYGRFLPAAQATTGNAA